MINRNRSKSMKSNKRRKSRKQKSMKGGVMTRAESDQARIDFDNELANTNKILQQLQSRYAYLDMYVNGGVARGSLTNIQFKQMETELKEIPGWINWAHKKIDWIQRQLNALSMKSM